MATINLHDKWGSKLEERFKIPSITDKWCGTNYEFTGVNTIKTMTLVTGELTDYDPTATANRFGGMTEVDDEMQSYTLTKKRSFDKAFDETHIQDQNFLKKGAAYLKQMWDEALVPEIDKYRFMRWAMGAGLGDTSGTSLTKTNVVEAMLNAHTAMDDAGVPMENRVTFVRSDIAVKYKLADEFKSGEGVKEFVQKRQIGDVEGSPLIKVPRSRMPKGVAFMVKYKQATADPVKLRMLRAKDDSDDLCGIRMQGLVRYDSFVLAQKADGIYCYFDDAAAVCAAPTFNNSSNSVTITSSGNTIKYTTDGTNPKNSATAKTYSSGVAITKDTPFRACASKDGKIDSPVVSYQAVYSGG